MLSLSIRAQADSSALQMPPRSSGRTESCLRRMSGRRWPVAASRASRLRRSSSEAPHLLCLFPIRPSLDDPMPHDPHAVLICTFRFSSPASSEGRVVSCCHCQQARTTAVAAARSGARRVTRALRCASPSSFPARPTSQPETARPCTRSPTCHHPSLLIESPQRPVTTEATRFFNLQCSRDYGH